MIDRNIKQDQIVESVINLYKQETVGAIIIACTGFGKTTCGFKIVKRFNKDLTTHVVLPTVALKEQWEVGVKERQLPHNIKTFVINSYLMLPPEERQCDLLILDEVHRYSNEDALVFNTVIEKTSFSYILALSATLTIEQLRFLRDRGVVVAANVSLHEAVANKWVSKFVQYNLAITFTDEEYQKYKKADNIMKAHAPYFEGIDPFNANKDKLALARYCAERGLDYKDVQMRIARYNTSNAIRKSIVYGAINKVKIVPSIIEHVGKKTIVFSETQKYIDEVHKLIPNTSVVYHSKLKVKEKAMALYKIKDNKVNAILTARALDEGLDVPALKFALIASGTSVERQQLQRMGRVGRWVSEDDIATIINLYVENTMEKNWLIKRQKNMTNIRWITEIQQIEKN